MSQSVRRCEAASKSDLESRVCRPWFRAVAMAHDRDIGQLGDSHDRDDGVEGDAEI